MLSFKLHSDPDGTYGPPVTPLDGLEALLAAGHRAWPAMERERGPYRRYVTDAPLEAVQALPGYVADSEYESGGPMPPSPPAVRRVELVHSGIATTLVEVVEASVHEAGNGNLVVTLPGPTEEEPAPRQRPADMARYEVNERTVGPRYDPSVRLEYAVWMGDPSTPWTSRSPTARLINCALAGVSLAIEGVIVVRPRHMSEGAWATFADWVFEGVTGVRPSDLQAWEDDSHDPDAAAAERAAGWDPNP